MLDVWEFLKNVVIVFSLFNASMLGVVIKAYDDIKARVDVRQSIKVVSMRSNRLWYWMGFGFVSVYITYFIYSSLVVDLGSFTQVLSPNDDAENLIIALLLDLPIATGAMVLGYVYGRKIFKK